MTSAVSDTSAAEHDVASNHPAVILIDVAIIGAGFGGLGAAIRLQQEGRKDFLIFERDDAVGGTWHVNTYPGAQCDIPSALYSFSFAPNPDWTRLYPLQPEIEAYLNDCADRFDIRDRIRFGHEVLDATWNDEEARWLLTTSAGTWSARILVGALGPFSEPAKPNIAGLESFSGSVFHSAEWNHEHSARGRRLAVIGTGASAVQFVPRIAPEAAHLTVFQRTPTWILPHPDRSISKSGRSMLRKFPLLQRTMRRTFDLFQEALVPGLIHHRSLLTPLTVLGRAHLRRQVKDPVLRRKLTPDYAFGCKRPTFSNKFYPALSRDNVAVETAGIARVVSAGIVTTDGRTHEVDTIVLGTGFTVAGHSGFRRIRGRDGQSLADVWPSGEMSSYRGTTVHGFPNFFMLLGPNSVVYTSQVVTIEAQVNYILDALRAMDTNKIRSLEVSKQAQTEFADYTDATLAGSVWNSGGCSSYYLSPSGRNVTYWPGSVRNFTRRMSTIELGHYEYRIGSASDAKKPTAATNPTRLEGRS
ncbi:NAD(P)/FAD-dependent oxidoreductase [Rhodococcus sp. PAMC28707]|uniref:flavin-containing monooxygenase n=1 Tax=unclassified Rhodococcus (in: high G+C Gram-positive bacteria) TaxID=192944 RepID=UPI00109E112D|nr:MULTISPECIES: NAD(P)/FAD-dependent oxidoreductase [unclassified Rhodococcus (in: high G+C Gram-positive bacteria)]QCB49642.1 NAD(P)/FAD-dependent oxidoreductase [Rhodococcus sp. PAMC28705]QCB58667.1 NAD(P)/FAD-dependent oxidoreductase [Rhodococcus sp. PAMC28707]